MARGQVPNKAKYVPPSNSGTVTNLNAQIASTDEALKMQDDYSTAMEGGPNGITTTIKDEENIKLATETLSKYDLPFEQIDTKGTQNFEQVLQKNTQNAPQTAQVDYRIPGGETRTETVNLTPEGYVEGTQNIRPQDAGVYIQTEKQREMGTPAWNALDPNRQPDAGGTPLQRPQSDFGLARDSTVFFGGRGGSVSDNEMGDIKNAFREQDQYREWAGIKKEIMYGSSKKGQVVPGVVGGLLGGSFGSTKVNKMQNPEAWNQQENVYFDYFSERHKDDKKIVGYIEDMRNRWTIGGNKNKKQNDPFKLGGSGQLFGMQTGKSPNSSDPSKIYKNLAKQSNTTVWWND